MKISVSYLKSIYEKEKTLAILEKTSCDYLHVDLMDGVFAGIKNYEIDNVCDSLKKINKPLDIHLMVKNPLKEIQKLIVLNPKFITIHVETNNVKENLEYIQSHNIMCGLAINPDTPLDALTPYLPYIDLVLVMSVNPGRGGQAFLKESSLRLQELVKIRNNGGFHFEVSVDGGINEETVCKVKDYVDIVVSGSFICMNENFESQINKIKINKIV